MANDLQTLRDVRDLLFLRGGSLADAMHVIDLMIMEAKAGPAAPQGPIHICGGLMVRNPHPDAGKPRHHLNIGYEYECVPCLVKSRHGWAQRALKAETAMREATAQASGQAGPILPEEVPADMVQSLRSAVEGECDGLDMTERRARMVLAFLLTEYPDWERFKQAPAASAEPAMIGAFRLLFAACKRLEGESYMVDDYTGRAADLSYWHEFDTALGRVEDALAAPVAAQAPAALPERDTSKPAESQGLFRKFDVRRVDGSDQPGGKHHGCRYYVLDVDHDVYAGAALTAYAAACEATHPELARDLREKWGAAPTPPASASAELRCRTLSDQDMDRIVGWLREQETGDIGFHGLCERVIQAFAVGSVAAQAPAVPELTDSDIETIVQGLGARWDGDYWIIEDADLHPMARSLLYRYTEAPTPPASAAPAADGDAPTARELDMAMLIKRLAATLRVAWPESTYMKAADDAMDALNRWGLAGSPLREGGE